MRQTTLVRVGILVLVGMVACSPFPSLTPDPTATPQPTFTPSPIRHTSGGLPTATTTPAFHEEVELGRSVEGRPILAQRFGNGPLKIVLVGNVHGGTEENTQRLMLEMIDHLRAHPGEVPEEVSLWVIPTANPDGLYHGTRSNARGVDLNRNFDTTQDACAENDWAPDTYNSEGLVIGGGGPAPGSEPETRILSDFLSDAQIVISYHSQAGYVLRGGCGDHPPTQRLGQVLSQATGYIIPTGGWIAYPVTGNLTDYLAAQGIGAAEIELTNKQDTEFQRNLEGVRAVLTSWEEILAT